MAIFPSDIGTAKEPQHPARDFSDWTRKGPIPDLPQHRVPDRHGRNFETLSDAGSERAGGRRFESNDGKVRDLNNWERKGPLSPVIPTGREGGRPRSNEGPNLRRSSPAWGEGRSQDGSRPPRRDFHERQERTPTAPELDNQWRARMRPDPPAAKEPSNPSSPSAPAPPAPAVRPRLNLQKRTVSENEPTSSRSADSKSSPFGAARPIDTAAREREVEERRERQKKEAEEKAKAEKTEKAEKQRLSKEQAKAEKATVADANGSKDGDSEAPRKNFEILRRANEEENGMTADPELEENNEELRVTEQAPAPKQVPPELPPNKANGNWRRNPAQSKEAPAPDEEGWSTVGSKPRGNRRGQSGRGFT
jgi:translation initiation factor 4B